MLCSIHRENPLPERQGERERALIWLRALGNWDHWKEPHPRMLTCAEHALQGLPGGRVLDAEHHQELSKNANSQPPHPSHLESKSAGDSYAH